MRGVSAIHTPCFRVHPSLHPLCPPRNIQPNVWFLAGSRKRSNESLREGQQLYHSFFTHFKRLYSPELVQTLPFRDEPRRKLSKQGVPRSWRPISARSLQALGTTALSTEKWRADGCTELTRMEARSLPMCEIDPADQIIRHGLVDLRTIRGIEGGISRTMSHGPLNPRVALA